MRGVEIRRFRSGDDGSLYQVFHSAIHLIAAHDYTVEQINAWAPETIDMDRWSAKMRDINPFVAEIGDAIVGYADVQRNGYIDHFFVSGHRAREGIGRALMERLHEEAGILELAHLAAHVSRTAQPFFRHYGFDILEQCTPIVRGVAIPNALMRKQLDREGARASALSDKETGQRP